MRSRSNRPLRHRGLDTDVVGERAIAQLVDDIMIVLLALLLLAFLIDRLSSPIGFYMLGAVTAFGYNVFFEGFGAGQTLGKKQVDIEVRSEYGELSITQAAIRNVPSIVSLGLLSLLVALFVMLIDSKNRRFFDFAAGTVVAASE